MKHNWEYKRFGELCDILRGGSPRPIQDYLTDEANGLNWIKIGDVAVGSKYITSTKEKIKPEGLKKTRQVHKGDFILSNSMSFGRPYILKIDGCIHDGWLAIRGVTDHYIPDFLFYFLSSPTTYSLFEKSVKGGVVSNLNSDIVKAISVPVPPIEVQKMIVVELDGINVQIDRCRQLLQTLDSLATSLFYDTFGDPITNPKGWKLKKLNILCSLKAGKAISSKEMDTTYRDGLYACYGGNGIRGYIAKYSHQGPLNIIGRQGALCGNVCVAYNHFYATEHAVVVTPKETLNHHWLYYTLLKYNLNQFAKGVAQPGLSVSTIGEIFIPAPSLDLQQQFAAQVEAIEAQKQQVGDLLSQLQTLLDSRMDYWFN